MPKQSFISRVSRSRMQPHTRTRLFLRPSSRWQHHPPTQPSNRSSQPAPAGLGSAAIPHHLFVIALVKCMAQRSRNPLVIPSPPPAPVYPSRPPCLPPTYLSLLLCSPVCLSSLVSLPPRAVPPLCVSILSSGRSTGRHVCSRTSSTSVSVSTAATSGCRCKSPAPSSCRPGRHCSADMSQHSQT